jgi:O-antigen/teichoic acid export membrane protein
LLARVRMNLASYSCKLNTDLLFGLFKRYAALDYMTHILTGVIFTGGFFYASFILDRYSYGVLTIIMSLLNKARTYVSSAIWFHLTPYYSEQLDQRNELIVAQRIRSIRKGLFVVLMIIMVLFMTVGRTAFRLYYGPEMAGYYTLVVLLFVSFFFFVCFVPSESFVYVKEIRWYTSRYLALVLVSFIVMVILGLNIGMVGIVLTYAFFYVARGLLFYLKERSITQAV